MIFRLGTSRPEIFGGSVRVWRVPLPRLPVKVFAICASGDCVVIPEQTSLSQLGHEQLDNVFEGLGKENIALE